MAARAIMIQGTHSNAGKSVLVTALCRIFKQDGFRVAPFKAQNMSLNSYVTPDGFEIGRAQGVQAEAAGIPAEAAMNPILLKPSGDKKAQIVLLGRPLLEAGAREYREKYTDMGFEAVKSALEDLMGRFDIIVIEGAGSPAEVNLKDRDIANMRVAKYLSAPVLLVGDVDRGGMIASIVGTLELLDPDERDLVAGLVVNKFRGDIQLLRPGLDFLKRRTGKPVVGVIPYFRERLVEDEDSVALEERFNRSRNAGVTRAGQRPAESLSIAVLALPRISNFTDFDPLEEEPGVVVSYVRGGEKIGDPDILIIPGTKNTVADLQYLRQMGYDNDILRLAAAGSLIFGICGGYQILGKRIIDKYGVESDAGETDGLGLLDIITEFEPSKTTVRVTARVMESEGLLAECIGAPIEGYEIHMGRSRRLGNARPWLEVNARSGCSIPPEAEGAVSPSGTIVGTYIHDIFHNDRFRRSLLEAVRNRKLRAGALRINNLKEPQLSNPDHSTDPRMLRDQNYDRLASIVRGSLDMKLLYSFIGLKP